MLKQWELQLLLDLVEDKLNATNSKVWLDQLTEVQSTLRNTEYSEDDEEE